MEVTMKPRKCISTAAKPKSVQLIHNQTQCTHISPNGPRPLHSVPLISCDQLSDRRIVVAKFEWLRSGVVPERFNDLGGDSFCTGYFFRSDTTKIAHLLPLIAAG
jgi:hypothetical protein